MKIFKKITFKDFVLGLFFICFYLTLFIIPRYLVGDDYWWHVKTGEWIISNKVIPEKGIFSWYALKENLYWFAHEWLGEVFLFGFDFLFKDFGPIIYLLFSILLISTLLCVLNFNNLKKNILFSFSWFIIGFISLNSSFTPRPHMIILSFLILLIFCCEKIKYEDNYKGFYFFVFISIAWSNFHGGSSNLLYIIPIVYFFANSFNFNFGRIESKKNKNSLKYINFALLNTFSILINPKGYKLLFYPYSYTNDHFLFIQEWQSPSLNGWWEPIILIIFICLIFFITNKNIDFSDLAIIGIFMILTLISGRFISWLFVISSIIIFKYIEEFSFKDKYLILEIFIVSLFLIFGSLFSIYNKNIYVKEPLDLDCLNLIKDENPKYLYNEYSLGSYLIYNDIDVFIDGRADMYTGYNFKDYFGGNSFYIDYSYRDFIDEYDFDMYILYKESYLYVQLINNENVQCLYDNGDICILKAVP